MLVLSACGPPPQAQDEASVVYRLKFVAEASANTTVTFPLPLDAAKDAILMGLVAPDGGTISYATGVTVDIGTSLTGRGELEAIFTSKKVPGWPSSNEAPLAMLSRAVPDAGPNDFYIHVNKNGAAMAQVEFEYTASRECGNGCGGKRSWKFSGPVGLALQPVTMTYVEE